MYEHTYLPTMDNSIGYGTYLIPIYIIAVFLTIHIPIGCHRGGKY